MEALEENGIEAITKATLDFFQTMLSLEVLPKAASKDFEIIEKDITGMIGCAGEYQGTMSLYMPNEVVFKCVNYMLGIEVTEIDSDTKDAVGEIANIIVGGAKNELYEKQINFNISTPTVIVGASYSIYSKSFREQVLVPFELAGVVFYVAFYLKKAD